MEPWVETYRGTVAPWECDVTEHFTIAYYFDRIAIAEVALAEELGLADRLRAGRFPRRFDVRFARELRAGSGFHIESAALEAGTGLRLGHRFIDSVGGEAITWFDTHWDEVSAAVPSERLGAWDGPEFEPRTDPKDLSRLIPSARGRVGPADLDEFGRLGLCGLVHKFTDSSIQTGAAIGLTADYIKTARRGFSTFELRLRLARDLKLGDPYLIRSGIAHLGNSSVRFIHVLTNPLTGAEIARLGQYGVQLDLDARRPAAISPEFRERAARLVLPQA
jgi:acyl-CoA thioester hydrolase